MGKVKAVEIKRPQNYGHYGELINDLVDNMTKQYYDDTVPRSDDAQTTLRAPGSFETPIAIPVLQTDDAVRYILPTQPSMPIADADGTLIYVPGCGNDIYGQQQSKLKTIIEMFPSGSICKIHLDDTDAFQAVIHEIKFSTAHFQPALHIEFFKLEDVFAMPVESSSDTLSQYPVIQSCVIFNPGQIESIDSSDTAEMSRELIKNEMLAIKKQIADLKDNLRQLSRLRNSGGSTSRLFSEIDQKYHAFARRLERERLIKQPSIWPPFR
jgi:hypothetical protein